MRGRDRGGLQGQRGPFFVRLWYASRCAPFSIPIPQSLRPRKPVQLYQVTVENFLRVLTGRHAPGTPLSRRLGSGPGSRVLVYMTGHGGDEFLKFHNHEEVGGADLVRACVEMYKVCD